METCRWFGQYIYAMSMATLLRLEFSPWENFILASKWTKKSEFLGMFMISDALLRAYWNPGIRLTNKMTWRVDFAKLFHIYIGQIWSYMNSASVIDIIKYQYIRYFVVWTDAILCRKVKESGATVQNIEEFCS